MNKTTDNGDSHLVNLILLSKQLPAKKVSDERIGWLEKYFLMRAVHVFGVDVTIAESTDVLVPMLGVSYKHICQSLKLLSALEIVSLEMVTKDRGRPVRAFHIHSERIVEYFQVDASTGKRLIHQPLIDSLLCWGGYHDNACLDFGHGENTRSKRAYLQDENHELDSKSRLIFSVLLAYADQFGFVDSIGQADIEAITAFSSDQQKRLVKELLNKGYIRSCIKGFTHTKMFGRVDTVYCLNTSKGKISGQPPINISLFVSAFGSQAQEFSEASQLCRIANQLRNVRQPIEPERHIRIRSLVNHNHSVVDLSHYPKDVVSVFSDKTLVDYLQFRLEIYATWFLEVPGFDGNEAELMDNHCDEIIKKIKQDAFPDSGRGANEKNVKIKDLISTPEHRDAAADILCRIAWVIAKKYHQFLSNFSPASLASDVRRLRVFPRSYKTPVFESLSLAIASLKMDKEPVNQSVVEYAHVLDNRLEINKSLLELSKVHVRGELNDIDYNAQSMALKNRADFSVNRYHDEENLDENLRRQCGLIT